MTTGTIVFDLIIEDAEHEWYVRQMRLDEPLADIYTCTLDLIAFDSTDGGILEEEVEALRGSSCQLTINGPDDSTRNVNGIVRSVADRGLGQVTGEGPNQGRFFRRAQIEVVPALWVMTRRFNARFFQGLSAIDVVKNVVKEAIGPFKRGEPKSTKLKRSDYPKRDYCTQYDESDYKFVMRLLQEEGVSFYFDHSGSTEVMVLVDSNDDYEEQDLKLTEDSLRLRSLTDVNRIHATGVLTHDRNWTNPDQDVQEEHGDGDHELLVYEASVNPTFADGDSGKAQARIRLEREIAACRLVFGSSIAVPLAAGLRVPLETQAIEGLFLVTAVSAKATSAVLYGDGFDDLEGEIAYVNEFTAIRAALPFRPQKVFKKPIIAGYLQGTVVGDEITHPDGDDKNAGYGRIKVEFNWDPERKTSCWMRVAMPWAGPSFGVWFLPRKGMEVIIAFQGGDPDKPLVIGCVHNLLNPHTLELPRQKSQSGIRTSSITDKKETGCNQVFFEDAKNNEELYLQGEKDFDVVVHNNQTVIVGDAVANERTREERHKEAPLDTLQAHTGNRVVLVGKNARANFIKPKTAIEQYNDERGLTLKDLHVGLRGMTSNEDKPKGDSDWTLVTGNQRNEVMGCRTHIVGQKENKPSLGDGGVWAIANEAIDGLATVLDQCNPPADWGTSGNETIEVFGNRKVQVHGDADQRFLGATKSLTGGAAFNAFLGVKADFTAALAFEAKLGGNYSITCTHDVEINLKEKAEAFYDRVLKIYDKPVVNLFKAKAGWFGNEDVVTKSKKKILLIAGSQKDLAPKANAVFDDIKSSYDAFKDAAKHPIKSAKSLVKAFPKLDDLRNKWGEFKGKIDSDTDKAMSEIAEPEEGDTAHVYLDGKEIVIGIGKDDLVRIKKGKMVLRVGGNDTVEVTSSKVTITGDLEVSGKATVKGDGKIDGALKVGGALENPSAKSDA